MKNGIISSIMDACDGFISSEIKKFSITESDMIKESQKIFIESLEPLSVELSDKVYDAAAEMADSYGRVGFQNGFRCAVLLMIETLGL